MKLDLSKSIDRERFNQYATKLHTDESKVELKKIHPPKSVRQNAYAHVVLCLFAIEFGYSLLEAKTVIKRALNFHYLKNGMAFLKSMADMDTFEVTRMIDYAREVAGQNGCYIPTSEEYLANQFAIDSEIDKNKNFL